MGARDNRDPEHLGFVLRGIKFIDDRIANPAYGLLLLTALLMAFLQYSIGTSWILIGLGIFIVLAIGSSAGYTPALKKQIEVLDRDGPAGAEYKALDSRATGIGMFLSVLAIAAVFVMVYKPQTAASQAATLLLTVTTITGVRRIRPAGRGQSPSDVLAMISFITSSVPAPMRIRRESRK